MNEKNLKGREKGLMGIPANYSLHRNRENSFRKRRRLPDLHGQVG